MSDEKPREAPLKMQWFDALEGHPDLGFAVIKSAFSDEEIRKIDETPQMLGSVFADDRSDGLEFHHNVWRIEVPLRRCFRPLYEKVLALAEECDDRFWFSVPKARRRYLLSPEIEYIEYDADANPDSAEKPSIEPHVDNGSLITMVAMLADPNADFEGGVNYFEPGITEDLQSDSSDSDASSLDDEDADGPLQWDWDTDSDDEDSQTEQDQGLADNDDKMELDESGAPPREDRATARRRRFRNAMRRIERTMESEPRVPFQVSQGAPALPAPPRPPPPPSLVEDERRDGPPASGASEELVEAGQLDHLSKDSERQRDVGAEENERQSSGVRPAQLPSLDRKRPGAALARRYALQKGDAVFFRGEKCEHWINDVLRGRRTVLQMELAKRDARDDWTPQTPYPEKSFRGPKRSATIVRNSFEKDAEEAEAYLRTSTLATKRFCRMHAAHKGRRRKAEAQLMDGDFSVLDSANFGKMQLSEGPAAEDDAAVNRSPDGQGEYNDEREREREREVEVEDECDSEDWLLGRKHRCLHSSKAKYSLLRWLERAPWCCDVDESERSDASGQDHVIAWLYLELLWELESDLTTTLDVTNENLCVLVHSVAMQYRERIENRPYLLKRSLLYK